MTGEFDLIARHFAPLAGPEGLGLLDDAALLEPPPGEVLALTTDAHVQGVHVLADETPGNFARRLMRTNLSDLAAKGARPLGYLLTLALPKAADDAWIAAFAAGLAADQDEFGIRLFGGDTVSTEGPVVANIAAIGAVPPAAFLRRAGAAAGDDVYVTGVIGDGVFGLKAASGELGGGPAGVDADALAYLERRYRLPDPRVAFGAALARAGCATAAADVSDGLLADAGHIARASGVAIEIDAAATPLSPAVRAIVASDPNALVQAITGGDDYELVFMAPPSARAAIQAVGEAAGLAATRIGRTLAGAAGRVTALGADGRPLAVESAGYAHR